MRTAWLLGLCLVGGGGAALALQDAKPAGEAKRAAPQDPAARKQARAEHLSRLSKELAGVPTTLAQAVQTAEQATGGKAVEAEIELEDDEGLEIEVVVLKDGKLIEVEIDPATGKVTETEEEDDDGDGDDDDGDDDGR